MNKEERKEFKLTFIKYYLEVKEEYQLTHLENLIYGYIKEVIVSNTTEEKFGCCFATSETISNIVGCNKQSVNNAVQKLKKLGLIIVFTNWDSSKGKRYRNIYLPGKVPRNTVDLVDKFFKEYEYIERTSETEAIIGDWIYKKGVSIEDTIAIVEYNRKANEILDLDKLKYLYKDFSSPENIELSLFFIEREKLQLDEAKYFHKNIEGNNHQNAFNIKYDCHGNIRF